MDTCRNNHEKTKQNIRIVKSNGKTIIRCNVCDVLSKQRYERRRAERDFVKCDVNECPNKVDFRGLCASHRKTGKSVEELEKLQKHETLLERIKCRISIDENGCWIWGGRLVKGYGYITFKNERMLTHRASFQAFYKTKLSRKDVLDHLCMVKQCCNPEHLQRVTQRENSKRSQAFYSLDEKYGRLVSYLKTTGLTLIEIEEIANGQEVTDQMVVS